MAHPGFQNIINNTQAIILDFLIMHPEGATEVQIKDYAKGVERDKSGKEKGKAPLNIHTARNNINYLRGNEMIVEVKKSVKGKQITWYQINWNKLSEKLEYILAAVKLMADEGEDNE